MQTRANKWRGSCLYSAYQPIGSAGLDLILCLFPLATPLRVVGHITGLRDQFGVTHGYASRQLLQPGGYASTPAWTGPSALRPQWSTPATNLQERPAWLGAAFDYYTAQPVSNFGDKSAVEFQGHDRTQGHYQGQSCECYHSKQRVCFHSYHNNQIIIVIVRLF